MSFSALHRLLGQPAGPITDDMVTSAIDQGLAETDDLDWKSELPPAKAITQTDYPKDIAAMANSGGGTIVYGITENQKAATGRTDVGNLDETHERALRSAPITAISPPVFGLEIHQLGTPGRHVVAIVVPPSIDGPHLIYRGEYFGAPIRNNADTVWMKERQIEGMYRARLDERRHTAQALTNLYTEAAAGRDTADRAWLIAVAHPRIPATSLPRPTRDDARQLFDAARQHALTYSHRGNARPLEVVDVIHPRPGLRRWIAPNTALTQTTRWKEAWASIHHDGSVTIAAAIGGHRSGTLKRELPGEHIEAAAIERAVTDLLGLIRAASEHTGTSEYETQIGIEWTGPTPLLILTVDNDGYSYDGTSLPVAKYTPATATIVANTDPESFYEQLRDLAQDCINQGGITHLHHIHRPQ